MAAYGNLSTARAGVADGLDFSFVESKAVYTGQTIAFGAPVFVKTGNESQAFIADSTDATKIFAGVALLSQRSFVGTEGEYPAGDAVNILTRGRVWVNIPVGESGTANKPAYVYHNTSAGADHQKFTAVTAGTYNTGAFFVSNPVGGLVLVEVNGRK